MENEKTIYLKKLADCKYGENAWQTPAAVFTYDNDYALGVDKFKLIAGTDLSYNNWCDIKRVVHTITHIAAGFDTNFGKVPKISIAVKHGNPCGASFNDSEQECLIKTIEGDTRAIFGGSVITNFKITAELADTLLSHSMATGKRLLDVIVAPSFDEEAIEILARKHGKCRLVANSNLANLNKDSIDKNPIYTPVPGGFLMQPNYTFVLELPKQGLGQALSLALATEEDIVLAWAVGSTSNSNTIILVKDGKVVGNGVGQQDRVGACKLAISRARDAYNSLHGNMEGFSLVGAVAYSDSFFPFNDAPQVLIDAGIKTIFSTSGSVNDQRLMDLCNEKGVKLIMLPDSEARGFFGH